MARTSTVLTIVGASAIASFAIYAFYFDYKRRNDVAFRKELRRQHKKSAKLGASSSKEATTTPYDLKTALEEIRAEPLPSTIEEREKYFLEQLAVGEGVLSQGPLFELPAAKAFYRALRVYPNTVELIMILQKSLPGTTFNLVMDLMNFDVKSRVEEYYDHWPSSEYNVKIEQKPLKNAEPSKPGEPVTKRLTVVATKDFAPGDVIYTEQPMATALDVDLEGKGTHCSHCLRRLEEFMSIKVPDDPLGVAFCSKACQLAATSNYHDLLFGNTPFSVGKDVGPSSPEAKKRRETAQNALVKFVEESGKPAPLIVARCIARSIIEQMNKLNPGSASYSFSDHLERLRYLEIVPTPNEEAKLVRDIFNAAVPGLEDFLKDDRYSVIKGKVLYNAIGISFGGGRPDKPKTGERFESWDLTRTPHGTSRQTGAGFYRLSSYLAHSCDPNVRPSFPKGTAELHLVANVAIKAGDELNMCFVRSTPSDNESKEDNRRNRRQELARGWRFACECDKCTREGVELQKASTGTS
ncbi:uncharacterized protein EI90DRAFT_3039762 [Cantharellus anzutake]|uniref:uncharacterized protein n=1 Tax=Cantharellus anzutake TaxID=1750568 RepID=UPI0019039AEF|nr:uncharacterized protein EI90DRAFT_3039762 [Cantharellus anzutake]KAF8338939.1 hypothetical protein EI90DRAFT_3039762 [Cantharellus anzutake]